MGLARPQRKRPLKAVSLTTHVPRPRAGSPLLRTPPPVLASALGGGAPRRPLISSLHASEPLGVRAQPCEFENRPAGPLSAASFSCLHPCKLYSTHPPQISKGVGAQDWGKGHRAARHNSYRVQDSSRAATPVSAAPGRPRACRWRSPRARRPPPATPQAL